MIQNQNTIIRTGVIIVVVFQLVPIIALTVDEHLQRSPEKFAAYIDFLNSRQSGDLNVYVHIFQTHQLVNGVLFPCYLFTLCSYNSRGVIFLVISLILQLASFGMFFLFLLTRVGTSLVQNMMKATPFVFLLYTCYIVYMTAVMQTQLQDRPTCCAKSVKHFLTNAVLIALGFAISVAFYVACICVYKKSVFAVYLANAVVITAIQTIIVILSVKKQVYNLNKITHILFLMQL